MRTFEEYQTIATQTPLALRNNRDRIDLPVFGLQTEAGKVGPVLASAFASGKLELTQAQTTQLQDRLADVLWYVALLCAETGLPMQDVVAHTALRNSRREPRRLIRISDSLGTRGASLSHQHLLRPDNVVVLGTTTQPLTSAQDPRRPSVHLQHTGSGTLLCLGRLADPTR